MRTVKGITKMTADEYYSSEQDYYIPQDNVADCKFQESLGDGERTLYAMNENASVFMLATLEGDYFYEGCLADVLDAVEEDGYGIDSRLAELRELYLAE